MTYEQPKERVADTEEEQEELRQLAALFEEAAVTPADQQDKK